MDGLNEMMRQPEGVTVVLAFLALLVAVMASFYGMLERAALARRLTAIEADMEERMDEAPPLSSRSMGVVETPDDEDSRSDSLPPGIRFV